MRYERKYRIEHATYNQVRDSLILNPAGFSERYDDRWVNSLYFDTIHFDSLRENIDGIANRTKYRIRWYGEDVIRVENPRLEHKIKINMVGKKEYDEISALDIVDFKNSPVLENIYLKYNVLPTVLVRYRRTYYESFDHRIRATVDRDLSYYPVSINSVELNPVSDSAIILEIKYDKEIESEIDECLQDIPFRLSKNSKYVHGMDAFWL